MMVADDRAMLTRHHSIVDGGVMLRLQGRRLSGHGVCGVVMCRRPAVNAAAADAANRIDYVFKPLVEEANSKPEHMGSPIIHRIKQFARLGTASPVKNGVIVGDSVLKECAAYIVDHDNWAGVPLTEMARVSIDLDDTGDVVSGVGSLQTFIPNDGSSEDIGSSRFLVADVHRIGLLDCRIFNLDRHENNIIYWQHANGVRLTPIDHGFSLPSWRDLSDATLCWQMWKQASVPFSDETRAYIKDLCPKADIEPLFELGLKHECIVTYILCNVLVQKAVSDGNLTLSDIGAILLRDIIAPEIPSIFESIVNRASQATNFTQFKFKSLADWSSAPVINFLDSFSVLLDGYIGNLSCSRSVPVRDHKHQYQLLSQRWEESNQSIRIA